jgi:hypothetical protein
MPLGGRDRATSSIGGSDDFLPRASGGGVDVGGVVEREANGGVGGVVGVVGVGGGRRRERRRVT